MENVYGTCEDPENVNRLRNFGARPGSMPVTSLVSASRERTPPSGTPNAGYDVISIFVNELVAVMAVSEAEQVTSLSRFCRPVIWRKVLSPPMQRGWL